MRLCLVIQLFHATTAKSAKTYINICCQLLPPTVNLCKNSKDSDFMRRKPTHLHNVQFLFRKKSQSIWDACHGLFWWCVFPWKFKRSINIYITYANMNDDVIKWDFFLVIMLEHNILRNKIRRMRDKQFIASKRGSKSIGIHCIVILHIVVCVWMRAWVCLIQVKLVWIYASHSIRPITI